MKKILLVCITAVFSIAGFAQNVDKEYSLSEYRSSDDLEHERYTYNSDMLLVATDILLESGIEVKDSLTYDASNNVIKLDRHQLLNGSWTLVSYIDYTYDANGNRLSRSNYNSFGGPTFTLGGVYNYFYENNRLTDWELLFGGTDLAEVCTLTYNVDGLLIEEFAQDTWNSGTLENSWKIVYQYNLDGTLNTSSQAFWSGSTWDTAGTEWFFYDDNKNCIKWDHKNGNTVTNRNEYEYNLEFTVDQLVLPYNPEDDSKDTSLIEMKNMPILQHWYTENDLGELVYVCDYIYDYDFIGTMGVAAQGFHADNFSMYPNPASSLITIASDKDIIRNIDIIDTTGKLVLKKSNLNNKETNLDVSNLQSGVYLMRLSTSKGIVTEKLIVQ
ncbi:T9SS type A sorting domain-containing protein [Aequorivita capsosiphonis]|uniref:T9SS type A sorting domain-containing protein n=1 Tax=Aequorivita capsosiphonis TaxID=487317 RepID=UPI0003FAA093|nr:T9SS type A sorting domain-containing protein [Aequorivita capsosiphonis]